MVELSSGIDCPNYLYFRIYMYFYVNQIGFENRGGAGMAWWHYMLIFHSAVPMSHVGTS